MRETAFAKINLALHVRGRRKDGYHELETVFAFAEQGDELEVAPADQIALNIGGPFGQTLNAGPDNLILRAANALAEAGRVRKGGQLQLDKRLPIAAGIGGGSADAAAALRLLRRFWQVDVDDAALHRLATQLGADVPACLVGETMLGAGIGDILTPLDLPDLTGKPLLLVNPGLPLSTSAVFAAWDGVERGPLTDWRSGRNDLEAAARDLVPEIGDVLAALCGAEIARMSGSGATCFGFYESEAARDTAAQAIASEHPDWWLLPTRLR